LYVEHLSAFSADDALLDRQPARFVRNDGNDLFDLDITFWSVEAIPTEDRAELIGAHARKDILGIEPEDMVGRLTVEFANGYSPSGTGGGTLGSKILTWLGKSEDQYPWCKWIETAKAAPVQEHEQADYEEGRRQSLGGLRIYELLHAGGTVADVVDGLLRKPALLEDAEVYCLKRCAYAEFKKTGVAPTCVPPVLLRKVIATARKVPDAVDDALALLQVCNLELAADEPSEDDAELRLEWWDQQIHRDDHSDAS